MPRDRPILLSAALIALSTTGAHALDLSKVTCRAFLESGQGNMAAMIMFLRGYHAGQSGTIPFDAHDPYGARLGVQCKRHPDANLIDTSEKILVELDRGI